MPIDKADSPANKRRIENVEKCFGNAGQPLRSPGRILVGEGILIKACKKDNKARQFFLFNDILVYGSILIHKKRYNQQHIIPLEEVSIKELPDYEGTDQQNGWQIMAGAKSFVVYAATPNERREWIHHIRECSKELRKSLPPTTEAESITHAPVWEPDSSTTTCLVCRETQFSIINRRHHCRKCGKVVCGACSSHKFLLPKISSRPLRVCTPCFHILADLKRSQSVVNIKQDKGESPATLSDDSDDSEEDEDKNSDPQTQQYNPAVTTFNTFDRSHDATTHSIQK